MTQTACRVNNTATNKLMEIQTMLDGTRTISDTYVQTNVATASLTFSDFRVATLSAGVHTLTLQFRNVSTGMSMIVDNAKICMYRVD